ncbi:MAG: PAS domain S-box protein [Lacibacter sp.]
MKQKIIPLITPYIVTILLVLLAIGLRFWPLHTLNEKLVWTTFYPAVMFASLYGGYKQGILATIYTLLFMYFGWQFISPNPFFGTGNWVVALPYLFNCIVIISIIHVLHVSKLKIFKLYKTLETKTRLMSAVTDNWNNAFFMHVKVMDNEVIEILYISKAVTGFLPYDFEYIQQNPITLKDLVEENELERICGFKNQAIKTRKPLDIDVQLKPVNGQKRWGNFSAHPHNNKPESLYWDCMFTEITDRKNAEEENRLLSEVVTNMADGVSLVSTQDACFLYANPNFEKMFGYKQGELIGKHVSCLNARTEKDPAQTSADIIKALNEKGLWEGEVLNIRKDGTQFWTSSTVSVFQHHLYGLVWVSVQKDISEAKRVLKELEAQILHNQRLVTELFIKDRDKERNRIAHELHEEINQELSTAKLYFSQLYKNEIADANFQQGYALLQSVIKRVDSLYQSISTPFSSGISFIESINMLIEKFNCFENMSVSIISNVNTLDHLLPDLKLMLYTSIEQYCSFVKDNEPELASVTINLHTTPENQLALQLIDNSKSAYRLVEAFDENYKKMQSRVGFLGGTLESKTTENGFEVDMLIPLV